ncbi:MAG TPA: hypothetical protein VFC00_02610 [Micromonosporaceae bacterium]|nr:hypothetical protein [Micromonosporaceae bacterium]
MDDKVTQRPPGAGNGGVLITFQHMYDQLQLLVGELRDVNSAMKTHNASMIDHEVRLRALEKWRYSLPAALVISIGSAVAAVIAATNGG